MARPDDSEPDVGIPPSADSDHKSPQFEDLFTFRLALLNDLLSRHGAKYWFAQYDLTSPQRRLLLTLGRYASRTIAEVSRITQMDKAQVSRSARELEQRGVIVSRSDDNDARLKRLDLTKEGKKLHRKVFATAQARQGAVLNCLSEVEVEEMYRLLAKLSAWAFASEAQAVRNSKSE